MAGTETIGKLHVNLTQYDPFVLKSGYTGAPVRLADKNDPYGPHAPDHCIEKGDCQIVRLNLRY
jgi:hypothetical protein